MDARPDSPAGMAVVTAMPAMHDFGSVRAGDTTSPFQMITVINTGTLSTGAIDAQLSYTDAAQFRILGNGCKGGSVAPLGECTMQVQFRPETATGGKEAKLTIFATPGGEVVVPLAGTGVIDERPRLAVSSNTANFGLRAIATTSPRFSFTITNPGATATGPISAAIGGADPAAFGLTTSCSAGLAPAATCEVQMVFRPPSGGAFQAQVTMSATPGTTIMLDVSGTGIDTALSSAPSMFDFGTIGVGIPSPPHTFTITNIGTDATGNPSATLTGADAGDFAIGSGDCPNNPIVASGTCTVDVRFMPQSIGAKTATLVVTASGATASVPLIGLAN